MNTIFFAQVYLRKEPPKRAERARKMMKIEEDRLSRVGAISLQTHVLVAIPKRMEEDRLDVSFC